MPKSQLCLFSDSSVELLHESGYVVSVCRRVSRGNELSGKRTFSHERLRLRRLLDQAFVANED